MALRTDEEDARSARLAKGRAEQQAHNERVSEGTAYRAWMIRWHEDWAHRWEVRAGLYYPKAQPRKEPPK